jgi:hypothetical protein
MGFQTQCDRIASPVDSRSEFSRINGILLSFESYSDACNGNFAKILDQHFVFHGILDERISCHLIYSHVLYHFNQCLLHHPFLLRQHLNSVKVKVPEGFLRGAVLKSREHANHLTAVLCALQQRGCKIYPSFYGYAATLAGVIHRLHSRNQHSFERLEAEEYWKSCLRFLDQEPVRWESHRRMVCAVMLSNIFHSKVDKLISNLEQHTVLKEFEPTPLLAAYLLSSTLDPIPLEPAMEETLWQICDYSWLTNSARPTSKTNEGSPFAINVLGSEVITVPRPGHTPNLEMLLGGDLYVDYGFLDYTRGDTNAGTAFNR